MPATAFQRPDRTSPFCSYRSYKHLMPRFVPAEALADVRVFPGRISAEQRTGISRSLALGIGRSEIGRHMLYVPVDGEARSLGLLRIHSEPGDYGLAIMAVFLDRELRLGDYSVIQYRGQAKAWLEGRADLRRRLRGADGETLRGWLDREGRDLSAAGVTALDLGGCAAAERRIVVHLLRIAAKSIATTEAGWGERMRSLGHMAPRPAAREEPQKESARE